MKKKGFTLIELMGVITILAIITFLVAPTIINQINNSKDKMDDVTKNLIYSAIDLYLDNKGKDYPKYNGSTYCLTLNDLVEDGQLSAPVLDSNGDEISLNQVIAIDVRNDDYNYRLPFSCETNIVKLLKDVATTSTTLGVNSISPCVTDGTECPPETALAIQVNSQDTYKFRVLNDDGENVTLIMSKNLGDSTDGSMWNDEEQGSYDTSYGTIRALANLKSYTYDWTNIPLYSYTLDYGEGIYSDEHVQNVRARLPKISDFENLGCSFPDENVDELGEIADCPNTGTLEWLRGGLDEGEYYWLSDASFTNSSWAWYVQYSPNVSGESGLFVSANGGEIGEVFGLRPVITLQK